MSPAKNYQIGEISTEQFVAEHTFCYIIDGIMRLYDGNHLCTLKAGECAFVRKNRLVRFMKEEVDDKLDKVFVFFDETFLKRTHREISPQTWGIAPSETILNIPHDPLLTNYVRSLAPYDDHGVITAPFTDVK